MGSAEFRFFPNLRDAPVPCGAPRLLCAQARGPPSGGTLNLGIISALVIVIYVARETSTTVLDDTVLSAFRRNTPNSHIS